MTRAKKVRLLVWGTILGICLAFTALVACSPQASNDEPKQKEEPKQQVEAPTPNENGIITAADWAEMYPDQYATYMENANNKDVGDYTEEPFYPQLQVIWEGTPFSHSYDEARSHVYSLDDVRATGRDPQTANCLTCKSSEFILMQDKDPSLNAAAFADVSAMVKEPISCYDCHGNEPEAGTVVIRSYFLDALGSDVSQVKESALSCGQCHNEYYFYGDNKQVANPYTSLATATPEAVFAYTNEIGHTDYTNPRTGTEHIKVQHPEFETIYGGAMSSMAKQGYACTDCHMAKSTTSAGDEYTNHLWNSPLENAELLANNCSSCHADLAGQVKGWQDETIAKEHVVADKLVELNNKLADAVEAGTMSEDQLNEIRALNRESQFYWDWVMVENSEGAHNPTLTRDTLALSETVVDKALALL